MDSQFFLIHDPKYHLKKKLSRFQIEIDFRKNNYNFTRELSVNSVMSFLFSWWRLIFYYSLVIALVRRITLHKMWQNTVFPWYVYFRLRTESAFHKEASSFDLQCKSNKLASIRNAGSVFIPEYTCQRIPVFCHNLRRVIRTALR